MLVFNIIELNYISIFCYKMGYWFGTAEDAIKEFTKKDWYNMKAIQLSQ